jgi:hypothetical protein
MPVQARVAAAALIRQVKPLAGEPGATPDHPLALEIRERDRLLRTVFIHRCALDHHYGAAKRRVQAAARVAAGPSPWRCWIKVKGGPIGTRLAPDCDQPD